MTNLTRDDFLEIEKSLGYLISNWANELANTLINVAKREGVQELYWNTSETLGNYGTNEAKKKYFYETLPRLLGFQKKSIKLRKGKKETFWCLNLQEEAKDNPNPSVNDVTVAPLPKDMIPLDKIPSIYQGAAIKILKGNRGPYTKEQLQNVYHMIKTGKERKREIRKEDYFTYNTHKDWDGGQRFSDVKENIVKQKISTELVEHILTEGSNAAKVFLSQLIDPNQHFDADVIGWALVAKLTPEKWIINQMQTDTLNKYLNERQKVMGDFEREEKKLSKESILDRLHASGKSVWNDMVSTNESFLKALQDDNSLIQSLPTNAEIEEKGISLQDWLKKNKKFLQEA